MAWIFHTGVPVVFERLDGEPHLTDEARALVRDALADDDDFSRLRKLTLLSAARGTQ